MDDIIEVCARWDKLVQENIPVEVHLTDIGFRIAMHYFIGYEDLQKYRIRFVHSRVLDERLPELKSPEDLEAIEFATHTEQFTFSSLVSKATNLRELHFGYSSLAGHVLSEMDFHLPNLKLLQIIDREVLAKLRDDREDSIVVANISGFLRKSFPSIEQLAVATMANKRDNIEYAEKIFFFIQNHCKTLKKLTFISSAVLSEEDKNSNPVNYVDEFRLPKEKFDLEKLASVKLEVLHIKLGENFVVNLEQWTDILNKQKEQSKASIEQ